MALIAATFSLYAQTAVANLVGAVTDESGAAVAGAQVTAINRGTHEQKQTITEQDGSYTIPQLLPGAYDVTAEAKGFKKTTVLNIELQVQQTGRIDISLKVGEVTQTVEVSGVAPLLQTEESSVGNVIDQQRIVEMPLNGRSFLQLAYLVPDTAQIAPGSRTTSERGTTYGDSAISIGGNRENANVFLLDGTINTDRNFNTFAIGPPVDAIQEFKVEVNSYAPEFGGQGGGQINVITKSGTNAFHGSGWGFFRNSDLDAKNFFDLPGPIPYFSQQQFGMTAGGRIIRNKLFWFGSYEGLRITKAQTSLAETPNAQVRTGDFSNYRDASGNLLLIYDPATTVACSSCTSGYTRTPFPGNIIPASRISPISTALLKYIDLPNQSTALPKDIGYFFNNFPKNEDDDQTNDRVDYIPTDKDHIFARYSFTNEYALNPLSFTGEGLLHQPGVQNVTFSESHVFSPTKFNDFRFGFMRFKNAILSENANKNNVIGPLGIANSGSVTSDPNRWGVPNITLSDVGVNWGDGEFGGTSNQRDNSFDTLDTFTMIRGRNTFKFGGELLRDQLNNKTVNYATGLLGFSGRYTQLPDSPGNSGSSIAQYLLGLTDDQNVPRGNPQLYMRRWQMALHFNDDIKLTANLTLNVGIRWEYIQPWTEKYNNFAMVGFFQMYGGPEPVFLQAGGSPFAIGGNGQPLNVNPTTGLPCSSCPKVSDGIILPDKHDFMPRLGLAWRPFGSNKWVVRFGAGVFFDTQIGNTIVDYARNPPDSSGAYLVAPNYYIPSQTISNFIPVPPGQVAGGGWGTTVNFPRAHIFNYNLSVERQLSQSSTITVQYVGSISRKLSISVGANNYLSNPDACALYPNVCQANGGIVPLAQRLVWQNPLLFDCCQAAMPFVNANYNAGVVKYERRFSKGLTVLSSYTFSKSIDNGGEIRGGGSSDSEPVNWYRVGKDAWRGVSNFDQTHRFITSWVWELPFGKGKALLTDVPKGADYVVGGWSINGIYTVSTGLPFTVYDGTSPFSQVPDVTGNPNLSRGSRGPQEWFNPSVYVEVPLNGNIGDAGRNNQRAPGLNNWDFGINKSLPISERFGRAQFRFEFFNAFNHPSFQFPNYSFPSANLGQITAANAPRIIQMAVKWVF
jgi:hypothetical protein